jgi:hypothetical protein
VVKNSLYTPKQLLFFYFVEQTIMMVMLLIPIASVLFVLLNNPETIGSLVNTAKSVNPEMSSNPSKMMPLIENFKISYSSIEKALELIFTLFFLLAFLYGGGLIKTYFMHVKFEKKHSLESKIFNTLLFISFGYMTIKDVSALIVLAKFKIILFPLLLCVGMFIMFYAGNNGFKLFHDSSIKSPVAQVPLWSFIILFVMSLGFSKLSYRLQGDLTEKFSELRFQGIFASTPSLKEIDAYYYVDHDDYNFKYLTRYFPQVWT